MSFNFKQYAFKRQDQQEMITKHDGLMTALDQLDAKNENILSLSAVADLNSALTYQKQSLVNLLPDNGRFIDQSTNTLFSKDPAAVVIPAYGFKSYNNSTIEVNGWYTHNSVTMGGTGVQTTDWYTAKLANGEKYGVTWVSLKITAGASTAYPRTIGGETFYPTLRGYVSVNRHATYGFSIYADSTFGALSTLPTESSADYHKYNAGLHQLNYTKTNSANNYMSTGIVYCKPGDVYYVARPYLLSGIHQNITINDLGIYGSPQTY